MKTIYIITAIGAVVSFLATKKRTLALSTTAKRILRHSDDAFMIGFFVLCMFYIVFLLTLLLTFPHGY